MLYHGTDFVFAFGMTLFAIPKLDKFGMTAFFVMAFIVPVYAVASFEGTMDTSVSRWLALPIVFAEAVVVVLSVFAGWRPINSWKDLPAHVRIAIALWLTVASIATIYSSDVPFSATFQSFWIIHGLFAWALWAMLSTKWRAMQLPLLVYFSVSLLFHSLVVYFVAWVLLGPNLVDWEPYMVGTTNPRLYIFYAVALLGMGLGFLIAARDRTFLFFAYLLIFSSYHLFGWTGGRASFGVSLILALAVAILARKHGKRIVFAALGCATAAFPLTLLTAPGFLLKVRTRLETQPSVAWPAFIMLMGLGGTSLLDGTLFYNQPLFFTALSIAILASVPATPKSAAKAY